MHGHADGSRACWQADCETVIGKWVFGRYIPVVLAHASSVLVGRKVRKERRPSSCSTIDKGKDENDDEEEEEETRRKEEAKCSGYGIWDMVGVIRCWYDRYKLYDIDNHSFRRRLKDGLRTWDLMGEEERLNSDVTRDEW